MQLDYTRADNLSQIEELRQEAKNQNNNPTSKSFQPPQQIWFCSLQLNRNNNRFKPRYNLQISV